MADKTIYKFPELRSLINEIGYKYCKLTDSNGDAIIPYNAIKKPLKPKLEEIAKRLKHLSPGVYCVTCQTNYGTKMATDKYYLGVGKYDPGALNDNPSMPEKKETLREHDTGRSKTEQLLSVDQAMENLRELADLKSECASLRAEVARLKEENAELEDELNDPENMSDNASGFQGFLKETLPALEPALDRYFQLREREQKFKETKFLHEGGYVIPGLRSRMNGNGKAAPKIAKRGAEKPKEVPRPGEEGWDEFIAYLLDLDDPTFEATLEQLEQNDQELYEAVCNEVFEEEEEQEQQED